MKFCIVTFKNTAEVYKRLTNKDEVIILGDEQIIIDDKQLID